MVRHGFFAFLSLATASCAGVETREVTARDVLVGLGHREVVPSSAASLDRDGHVQFPVQLLGGSCIGIVAVGGRGIDDLGIEVLRPDGRQIGRDRNVGPNASAVACASTSEEVEVVVTALRGHGDVRVHVYSMGEDGGGVGFGAPGSTCANAEVIEAGASIQGTTSGARHAQDASCFGGGSPEVYYRIEVAVLSQVTVDVVGQYDCSVALFADCGGAELGCSDDYGDVGHSRIGAILEPGSYVIAVDGYGGDAGSFQLNVAMTPARPISEICATAEILTPGMSVDGSTASGVDRFAATCADGARSADAVRRLVLTEPSRVRVVQETPSHDGALYLRRTCAEETSELACNDDWNGVNTSVVTSQLQPGTYYVFSDGFSAGNEGAYSIRAEVAPAAGTGGEGDVCDGAPETAAGSLEADTFTARDDYAGSCGGRGGADIVRRITVTSRANLVVRSRAAQFTGHVYVRRATCDGAESICRSFDISPGSDMAPLLETMLEPGTYFLFVDGSDVESFGAVTLEIELEDTAALQAACEDLPALAMGRDVQGTTAGRANLFEASCAGGAASPDTAYRIVVRRRSSLHVELRTSGFDGALHLRRACMDRGSELACNDDDQGDTSRSALDVNLEPGTYTLVVDGYATDNAGSFTLRAALGTPRPELDAPREPGLGLPMKAASR